MLAVYMHYCIMWGTEEFTASSKNLGREKKNQCLGEAREQSCSERTKGVMEIYLQWEEALQ